jgi:hypothetical protein
MSFRWGAVAEKVGDASQAIKEIVLKVQCKLKEDAVGMPVLDPLETIVFFHMYAQVEKHSVVRVTPVELNQIVMAYMRGDTSDPSDPLGRAVMLHHDLVKRVDARVNAYMEDLPADEYNIQQRACCCHLEDAADSSPSEDIRLTHIFSPIVGYGEIVQPLMLVPSLSALNVADVYARAAGAAFVVHYMWHEQVGFLKRYRGKSVRTTVVTLDDVEVPIVFTFSAEQLQQLRPHVIEHLRESFLCYHELFVALYHDCYGRNAAKMSIDAQALKKFPRYLKEFLKRMCRKQEKERYANIGIEELRCELNQLLKVALSEFWEE